MSIEILEHEPLSRHTTFRTGGPARFFVEARTEEEIGQALILGRERGVPVFVLGSGSNVLASDEGFAGIVIRMAMRGLSAEEMAGDTVEVVAAAGEEWDAVVAFAVAHGLYGLENLSLIPGRVGAAVVGNIGAYGTEVKDVLAWTETLDMRTGAVRRWTRAEGQFGYRQSFFKSREGRSLIVTRSAFTLRRSGAINIKYRDVQEYFTTRAIARPMLAEVREAVCAIRRRKLPDLARFGTAGSFFKNPVIPRAMYEALAARHPGLPGHDEGNQRVKVPLGWILDKVCGLKGARRGRVGTHAEQALVIVSDGGTAAEVEAFARELTGAIKDKTGLDVEWEVERMG